MTTTSTRTFIVVLPDGETWDTDATLVRVTDEQLDAIHDGEKPCNVVDFDNLHVCYPLGVENLNIFLSDQEEEEKSS